MTTETCYRGYVRTKDGTILVQLPDQENQWGFSLYSDDQSWPGGFGAAAEWTPVAAADVPADDRERLGWLLGG